MSRWRSALIQLNQSLVQWCKACSLVLLLVTPLRASYAQAPTTTDPLAAALASYNDLEYDAAATRFRAALALTGAQRLTDADRARAFMYLGATEHFRGARAGAVEAFRSLLIVNPRYRPSEVVFSTGSRCAVSGNTHRHPRHERGNSKPLRNRDSDRSSAHQDLRLHTARYSCTRHHLARRA